MPGPSISFPSLPSRRTASVAGLALAALLAAGCKPTFRGDVRINPGERVVLEAEGDEIEVDLENLGPASIATFLYDGAGLEASDPVLAAGDGWSREGPGSIRLIVRNLDPEIADVRLRVFGHDSMRMELRGGPNASPEPRPVPVAPVTVEESGSDAGGS